MEASESDDDLLSVTDLSRWLRIEPDIIQELADKSIPRCNCLPSGLAIGFCFVRMLSNNGNDKAREFNY